MNDVVKVRPTLAMLREKRGEILALAAYYNASNVRVFGSVARGESTPDSDIDFLVNFDQNYTLLDQSGLLVELRDLLGYPVNVVHEPLLREKYRPYILQDTVLL
jgi:uncharacterized protein